MIKVYCDFCGDEMVKNYIAETLYIGFDKAMPGSTMSLIATVKGSIVCDGKFKDHLCKSCLLKAVREGAEAPDQKGPCITFSRLNLG